MIKKEFGGLFGGFKCYLYTVIFNEKGAKKWRKKEEKRACQEE